MHHVFTELARLSSILALSLQFSMESLACWQFFVKYFWIFFNSDSKKEEGLLWGLCSGKRMMFSQFKYSHVHMCDYAYLKIV